MEMNQYEKLLAVEKIEGYYMPRPHEEGTSKELDALGRAKAECLSALRRQIECVEAISAGDFCSITKRRVCGASGT